MQRGKFITFEGCEGAGKTTQINKLYDYLIEKNINVLKTREPGGTKSAELIRNILIDKEVNLDIKSELLLHITARNEHIKDIIEPNLQKGYWVLCDRFTDSTVAYQGYGHNLGEKIIYDICRNIFGEYHPDYTFFIDIEPIVSMERAKSRYLGAGLKQENFSNNRYEQFDLSFHNRVYNGFKSIMLKNSQRFFAINGNQEAEKVANDIILALGSVYKNIHN